MSATAYIDGIPVPYLHSQDVRHEVVADKARTASGRLRRDVVIQYRTWTLRTRDMPFAERSAIVNHLRGKLWGFVDFWIIDLGEDTGETIRAEVEIQELRTVLLPGERQMTLTITEQ